MLGRTPPPRRGANRTKWTVPSSPKLEKFATPRLRADWLLGEPLADDGCDAIAAHGYTVQGVGDFHRALLVSDDDELGVIAQLAEDLDEAAEVDVIERGLDLIHDVERAGAGLEDRDEHRDGGEGTLASGKQRQPLDLLAGWTRLDLDAGGEHVGGVGEHEPAL